MTDIFEQIGKFNEEVCGLVKPKTPARLSADRKRWTVTALAEELDEYVEASDLENEADALLDLIYFAGGRLYEMGLNGLPLFEEIQRANMAKKQGALAKRPGSLGHDAIKPDGWTPPALGPIIDGHWHGLKIAVIGHAQHGKDTVCEILRDEYGLAFQSSSMFCSKAIIWPMVKHPHVAAEFLATMHPEVQPQFAKALEDIGASCSNPTECWEQRGKNRHLWYEIISWFNNSPTRLAREILRTNSIYCGIRNVRELEAIQDMGIVDFTIWVDASLRMPKEASSSITVTKDMADIVIDNNGGIEKLYGNCKAAMDQLKQVCEKKG